MAMQLVACVSQPPLREVGWYELPRHTLPRRSLHNGRNALGEYVENVLVAPGCCGSLVVLRV